MRPIRLLAVPMLFVLVACPPVREDGGGGGGGGNMAFTDGALVVMEYAEQYGYDWASLAFRPDGTVTCDEWEASGYNGSGLGGDWIHLYLYRGADMPWEQTYYSLYDYEYDCGAQDYEYSDIRCAAGSSSAGDYFEDLVVDVTSWTDSRVRGNVVAGSVDEDFSVENCGLWGYDYGDDDDDDWDDDDSGMRDEEREEPGSGGGWQLRIR